MPWSLLHLTTLSQNLAICLGLANSMETTFTTTEASSSASPSLDYQTMPTASGTRTMLWQESAVGVRFAQKTDHVTELATGITGSMSRTANARDVHFGASVGAWKTAPAK